MEYTLTSLSRLREDAAGSFDAIIDVRSPAEWAEDHLPGALSMPVLDDEERARVGTIYTRESPFRARKIGAALVARNAARHIEERLADMPGGWRPLIYCWRGGQRSNAFATILRQIGWRVAVLDGGYRSFRRSVVAALYEAPVPARVVVLDGNTGTAKTALLAHLAAQGAQVVDLEALANHRGSVFGGQAGGQPTQRAFETALAMELVGCDPARPLLVEAESSKVGALRLPPVLWKAMREAPRIEIAAPLTARAAHLARSYRDVIDDPAGLAATIERLAPQHPAERIREWQGLAAAGAHVELAAALMEGHYDPRYAKSRARGAGVFRTIEAPDLAPAALGQIAAEIARAATEAVEAVARA
jgi:tRNA 2-selenouridine synthase